MTYGGYSDTIIVDEDFALSVPKHLDLAAAPRCSARASPPIRRCATTRWPKAKRSVWWASAVWATWV